MTGLGQEARAPLREETVVLPSGARLAIALWRDAAGSPCCRLCFTRGARCLVRYDHELRGRARRQVNGRRLAYEFRSVEQLRYDFECDVEKVEAAHGARA